MEEHVLETNRGNIYYRKSGKGQPLLLLHGNGESSTIFEKQYSFFNKKFQVFAMDTRGHGKSDLGVETLSMEQIAKDIILLLNENNIDSTHIIGYSDGGNIGLYLAAHYPEKVCSLITMGANFEEDGLLESAYQEILVEKENIQMISNKEERIKRLCIHNLMLNELKLTSKDLRAISAPVLIMAGENDLIKRSQTEKISSLIPRATFKIIPCGGHDFFVTHPKSLQIATNKFYQNIREEK